MKSNAARVSRVKKKAQLSCNQFSREDDNALLPGWLQNQCQQLLTWKTNAWMLYGEEGLGQYELALALAGALLCEKPLKEGGMACGLCPSCHALRAHTHADLFMLMPQKELLEHGWPVDVKSQVDMESDHRKSLGKEIQVHFVRAAIDFACRTSARGFGKVILVFPAEHMNAISANALLKTLEEPASSVKVIIATHAAHRLLPTIRSRCLAHAVTCPPPQQALDWLVQQGIPEREALILLSATGGHPQSAWKMRQQVGNARSASIPFDSSNWNNLPLALKRGDFNVFSANHGWTPELLVKVLQKCCHDLMLKEQGADPRFFSKAALPCSPKLDILAKWSLSLQEFARVSEHSLHNNLAIEFLVARAQTALNSN